jgi:hypothetical protein
MNNQDDAQKLEQETTAIAQQNNSDAEILDLRKKILEQESLLLSFKEKMSLIELSPEIAKEKAEFKHYYDMATTLCKAKKDMTPEQCLILILTGKSMGMSAVKSMNSLYGVNGSAAPYGHNMVGILTGNGWEIAYDESKEGICKVTVSHQDKQKYPQVFEEKAARQEVEKGKAFGFDAQSKMRFHAVRKILKFYLPHLLDGVGDLDGPEFSEYEELQTTNRTSDVMKGEVLSFDEKGDPF